MYNRLLILGITGMFLFLGLTYLLVYPLKQSLAHGRDRQDQSYWRAFNAIEQFGAEPGPDTEQKAKAAINEARLHAISKTRQTILETTFDDFKQCYQGDRDSCKKANSDLNQAIRAPR